jgi:glyoxylase-like metal-dependent hydrolase (beta-lactamase superfamily II)
MNRRQFLQTSSLATLAALLAPRISAQNAPQATPPAKKLPPTEFKELRGNVGYFSGQGGTIGYLASAASLVAVDTQFPETAQLFLDGMPHRAGRKLDCVINTHHHSDHTGGNGTFKPVTQAIVAQRNVPKLQLRAGERARTHNTQVFPDTLFDESWRLELADEVVSARYLGAAHTGGDAIITFEKANVIHMGDLVFNRLYPVIDRPGGGNIANWVKVLEKVAVDYPADGLYVFGHGNPSFGVSGKREDLLVMRNYLSALLAHVQKEIAAGKTKAELVAVRNMPGFDEFHPADGTRNRFASNLEAAYDELTAKPAA